MYLIINGYEFGQWLRILLWIGLPGMMFLTMLATWIHYRRSRTTAQLLLQMEGTNEGETFSVGPGDRFKDESMDVGGDGRVEMERSVNEGEDDYKENLYKGILWMKEKYEQYRDLADERYERLKEQLTRMEQKYEDLLTRVRSANPGLLEAGSQAPAAEEAVFQVAASEEAVFKEETNWRESPRLVEEPREFNGGTEVVVERAEASGDRIRIQEMEEQLARTQQRFDEEVARLRHQLDEEIARGRRLKDEKNAGLDANRLLEQQLLYANRQLEEKQRMIADMEGQQSIDRLKIEELVTKLRNNSMLLMNIYQELDKSLHFNDGNQRPDPGKGQKMENT